MGETRVDLLHLLEDLRDAYPGAIEETILIEIVANSLDAGARRISLTVDPAKATLSVVDNGAGMKRRELVRYHDLAASTKARGQGIGFAGVGIKLGLLICEDVITETRRSHLHIATRWHLASRHKAPWKWTDPPGQVEERGTAVRLKLQNPLSPLLDEGFIDTTLRRCYQPLLDPAFDQILSSPYPKGISLHVNGRDLERAPCSAPEIATIAVRLARKRKPSALGYLTRLSAPLPEDQRGLSISTFGKVIKHGWDWLGVSPSTPERVSGFIEAPALAESLTLNKGDFIRTGARGTLYLAYRKAIQEAVTRQLELWGETRAPADEAQQRAVRPLARDLEQVLVDLSEEFPLLAALVEKRAGGQKRLPIGKDGAAEDGRAFVASSVVVSTDEKGTEPEHHEPLPDTGLSGETEKPIPEGEQLPGQAVLPTRGNRPRPVHYGLSIRFESHPDEQELGRLVESAVVVNVAHPAYQRASASRSEGYHIALTVALALARLAVEPAREHDFVTAFLARWGASVQQGKVRLSQKR